MGVLRDGEWLTQKEFDTSDDGAFERQESRFRNWVTADGSAGPTGDGGFKAESGRYHLYVSLACPWAHRTLIFRALKSLEDHISVAVVHPLMGEDGWTFETDVDGATGDRLLGKSLLREVYLEADPNATTRVTVPVLWDKKTKTIVSNESSEIIRMFNSAFDGITGNTLDFRPEELAPEIDIVNDRVYPNLNNGVYRSGFATSQAAYDGAVRDVFETLDWMEERLSGQRYLAGNQVTEADWRAVTTLFRFDPVYHGHFKCNLRRLIDYPSVWAYARELYQVDGIAGTVDFDHIVQHYHRSHESINPHRIVPIGPELDWDEPHGRDDMTAV